MTARFLFLAAIACLALHINYPEGFTRPRVPPGGFENLSHRARPSAPQRTVVFGKITKADAVRLMASSASATGDHLTIPAP